VESEAELGLGVLFIEKLVFTPAAIRFIDCLGVASSLLLVARYQS
jgi:hypothetical protein